MKTGIELIAQERREQIEKHGRTLAYDRKENRSYQLSHAASGLLFSKGEMEPMSIILAFGKLQNWDKCVLKKMVKKTYKQRLIIAGALIAAEIDRVNKLKG